ncbi:head fiber protein [Hypnocyclicus thermotrophus]|uniref:Head fiber protein n=1 Tax=Hypnocyclicus thermotrophus TaxID=1627895 RepID=A0AA46I5V8_9FUSO|nr:head fiber protein [Hypnocyclicus thermotrophus]TDT71534.1 head fiber protein [Hypnocyclicus thermotrophus]
MSYNAKNYTEQGGEKTVIGGTLEISGTLEIKEGAAISGLPKAEMQADSTAEDISSLVTDFNALLTKLKAAGFIATE